MRSKITSAANDPGIAAPRRDEVAQRVDTESQTVEEALLRPVHTGNAFENTVERLLQGIRLGVIAPGHRLPAERDLAVRLGVSRDTVRDAIKSLSMSGYLYTKRGRSGGTFLFDELPEGPHDVEEADRRGLMRQGLDDALKLRAILEVGAVRFAAARTLSAVERESLWSRLTEIRNCELTQYRRLDSRLHLAIAELASCDPLMPMIADSRMHINRLLDDIPLLERNIAHSNRQHEAIVIAILAGDAARAAHEMEQHLAGTAALLRGFLA